MERSEKISELIKKSREFLGVPWVHQGRSIKGVDCVGFLLLAFKHINIDIIEIKGYSRHPDGVKLKKIMDEQPNLRRLKSNEPLEFGDILLLRIRREPQHVAMLVPSTTADFGMIHAYNGGDKKVIEHNYVDYWKNKVVAIYRLK